MCLCCMRGRAGAHMQTVIAHTGSVTNRSPLQSVLKQTKQHLQMSLHLKQFYSDTPSVVSSTAAQTELWSISANEHALVGCLVKHLMYKY